jgi:hypothetical protein
MSQSPTPDAPPKPKPSRSIPPWVWIVVAVLLAGFIVARLQAAKSYETPHGATAAPAQTQP